MAKKEIKTDLWVARQLDDSKIKYDAQGSDVKEINDALQSASKRGTGNAGYPEYVAVVKDFVIVIEDKADLAKHQKLIRLMHRLSKHLSLDTVSVLKPVRVLARLTL